MAACESGLRARPSLAPAAAPAGASADRPAIDALRNSDLTAGDRITSLVPPLRFFSSKRPPLEPDAAGATPTDDDDDDDDDFLAGPSAILHQEIRVEKVEILDDRFPFVARYQSIAFELQGRDGHVLHQQCPNPSKRRNDSKVNEKEQI